VLSVHVGTLLSSSVRVPATAFEDG